MVAAQDTATTATTLHPIGETANLGPWAITVLEVVAGDEAASLMLETNSENPEAPKGLSYVCVRIGAQNTGDVARSIQLVDFAASGGDGVLRRTQAVVVPEPMLQAIVEPGASTEGWVAVTVSDPSTAILWFDSAILGGNWTEAVFALADGATAPEADGLDAADTDVGSDPANPAAMGETVKVNGWEITITDVQLGGGIFDLFDFRTAALGSNDDWINNGAALYATVRNMNPFPAFFSEIAFEIADFDGEPWDHTLMLTAPDPDVSREYLPGATGEGWTTFGGWSWTEYNLLRISPFKMTDGVRFMTFGGTPSPAGSNDATAEADTESNATAAPLEATVGDIVETSEDLVNLREEPSSTGKIIKEMPLGTQLEITGDATEADSYTWYPVKVVDSGEEGFVVQDFLILAGN